MATISASNLTFIIFWMKLKIFPIYRFLPSPTFWNFEVDNNNSNESNYKKQQVDDDGRSKKERTLHTHRLQNFANTGIRTHDLASDLGSK